MSVKWLKEEEKQAIESWLNKKNPSTKISSCPFYNLAIDKNLSQGSFCWICEKAFPLINLKTRRGCPCYKLGIEEVERMAKKLIRREKK